MTTNPQEQYNEWADKQRAMGKRIVPEDERAPIPDPRDLPPVADSVECFFNPTYDQDA